MHIYFLGIPPHLFAVRACITALYGADYAKCLTYIRTHVVTSVVCVHVSEVWCCLHMHRDTHLSQMVDITQKAMECNAFDPERGERSLVEKM